MPGAEALLRDVLVMATLPALWIDRRPERIVDDAVTLLRRLLPIDAACGELAEPRGPRRVIPASASGAERAWSDAICDRLDALRASPRDVQTIAFDGAELHVIIAPLGVAGEAGTLAVASRRPGALGRSERILLDIAANQTGIALKAAYLVEQLRQTDQRKDEFLATLAHELRNPLGAIGSAAQVLARDEVAPDLRGEMLDLIGRQVSHLSTMVNDLLDVSRLTRGIVTIERAAVDVRGIVERAVGSMRMSGRLGRHEVTARIPAEPAVVRGDEARLEQIVTNLLDNAVRYTPTGGHVEVAVTRAEGVVHVTVRDDGAGIPPEFLPHMFELFAQAPRQLDRASGGLGIGLAIVRELVHLHDGWVRAESPGVGRGSAFTVSLPLAAGGVQPQVRSDAPPVVAARRVVLIEDNADARIALSQLLELDGHEVQTAVDGESGLDLIVAACPDVAFIDVGLPRMDGYAVARAVRAKAECASVSLVALTGYGQDTDRDRALSAGFDAHVVKPFDHTTLARILAGPPRGIPRG